MEDNEYSMGTAPILETLKNIYSQESPEYDTILLNLGTILRNCSSNKNVAEAKKEDRMLGRRTKTPAHILIKESRDEILRFSEDVCSILDGNQNVMFPHVIVYFVNYRKCIPEHLYRPFTESEREIALAEASLRGIVHGARKDGQVSRVTFIEYPIDSKTCPHRLLSKEISTIKNSHNVIMISNHRIDYHVHKACNKFMLIDSFTGNQLTAKDLPKKVFGNEVVPFNTMLHAILGDKDDIKCSLKGKEKTQLIEYAEKDRWLAHSEDHIRTSLRKLRIQVPFVI
jgi:hypothetical protein